MISKKNRTKIILSFSLLLALLVLNASILWCQYWTALPPYNTLWPLWSPALSPVDLLSGLPMPIVTSLAATTVLPVQPGLTWDPSMQYPWLLYNSPFGSLLFFDAIFGINPWPPASFTTPVPTVIIGPAGTIVPITLPANFGSLPPTDPLWLLATVPLANDYYAAAYRYYTSLAPAIAPLFTVAATGYTLPPLLPDFLASLLALNIALTITVPPVLSAAALLGQ